VSLQKNTPDFHPKRQLNAVPGCFLADLPASMMVYQTLFVWTVIGITIFLG